MASLAAVVLLAASPHYITGPTASLDTTTGDYTISFKEAGLGSTPITYTINASTATFTFQCFNHGGNNPQGAPNSVSVSNESSVTTITPHNGQITATVSLSPELGGASCQGGGLQLFLIAVDYSGVTFSDSGTGQTFDMPELSASGLKVGPF